MWVNNLPEVATQWNSGATRESNPRPRAKIPSALTTKILSHSMQKNTNKCAVLFFEIKIKASFCSSESILLLVIDWKAENLKVKICCFWPSHAVTRVTVYTCMLNHGLRWDKWVLNELMHPLDFRQSVTGLSRLLDPVSGTLPEDITISQSLSAFCQHLKTWLFRKSYPDIII